MGALSSTNTNYLLPSELREALGLPYDRPTGPYAKRSLSRTEYANGLRAFEVPAQLTTNEAAALFEVWSRGLALHTGRYLPTTRKGIGLLTPFQMSETKSSYQNLLSQVVTLGTLCGKGCSLR